MDQELSPTVRKSGHILSKIAVLPELIKQAGGSAHFAWDEFFAGTIRNPNTRVAYLRAVQQFLRWCQRQRIELHQITPGDVGTYFIDHPGSIPTKKQHLAAIRGLFDILVKRHAVVLNPSSSVRLERYQVMEGKTPEITVKQARQLLGSIKVDHLVGLRDRAVIAVLIYTATRVGAVAKLRLRDLEYDGGQWALRFREKGGKAREIPMRHDLEQYLLEYRDAVGLITAAPDSPLFRTARGKTGQLTENPLTAIDMCRLVKRRLRDAGLPARRLSPHSFRVATITDLLTQGVPLEDVQHLAGHADPRTTRLYDRRQKKVTRNIVERISI